MFNKFFKNTFWLTFGEIIGRLLRIVLVLYAARVLGAANWGVFSYALSMAAMFTVLADIGLGAVMTREIVKDPDNKNQYLSNSLIIKIVFILLVSMIIILVAPLFTNLVLSTGLLVFVALLVMADNLRLYTASLNRALEKMHLEAVTNIVTQFLIMALGLWVLMNKPTAENLAVTYVIGSFIGLIFSIWTVRHHIKDFFGKLNKALVKKLLQASWPIALLGLLGSVMLNTDIIMLGWMRSAEDIGYYSSAQKIIFTLYVLPALIGSAAFPSLARMANKNKEEFGSLLEKSIKISLLIAAPIAIGGFIIGPELVTTFFGKEYMAAASVFRILLLSLVINYPTTILGNALFAYNQEKEFMKYSGIGAIANIIFNFMLIPVWGINGAAIATVFTQFISSGLMWIKMKKVNNFSVMNKTFKIFFSSFVMGITTLAMHYWNVHFSIIIFASAAIYFVTLYLVKESTIFELKDFLYARSSH